MLRLLRIENLVLARQVSLEFSPGLNLITGETGAGKSLIVNALALALGARGESSLVRDGERRALVEAVFDLRERGDIESRLALSGYEVDDNELLIRREIGADGRSRALIGGSTVTLTLLRELTAELVEMHGQHEQQTLLQPETHREILDRFGQHHDLLESVRVAHAALREIAARLHELSERAAARESRRELLEFRLAEIDQIAPLAGEEAELRQERDRLRHAEEIGEALRGALELLYEGEGAAVEQIHAAGRRLRAQAEHGALYEDLAERLEDLRALVNEITLELRGGLDDVAPDPARLSEIEDRLHALERLRRRFDGLPIEQILNDVEQMRMELDSLTDQRGSQEQLTEHRESHFAAYRQAAEKLHEARERTAGRLAARVGELMRGLAMPRAELEVVVEGEDAVSPDGASPGVTSSRSSGPVPTGLAPHGLDAVEFYLRANPGEPSRPLRKVASGGELSRLMLAIDVALEGQLPRRTLLFDEVDQGLGGEAAEQLGEFLSAVSRHHQVICITHLPQVAVRGETHVRVNKKHRSGRTVAVVRTLEDLEDRIEELARMLGGSLVTETARRHAEAMMEALVGHDGGGNKQSRKASR
ncbi:MAG: DNA repair protein RecN [Acidobacteriota bacterium]|nr:MAG: DNA repair protein RecN [Acidobacteriota bacterium]